MAYLDNIPQREKEWIENDPTFHLFKLACVFGLKYRLFWNGSFHSLYRSIPAESSADSVKPWKKLWDKFQQVFNPIDLEVAEIARHILEKSVRRACKGKQWEPNGDCGYYRGRFAGWQQGSKDWGNIEVVVEALLSEKPFDELERIIKKHNGKIPGFRAHGLSQLAFLLRPDLFPLLHPEVQGLVHISSGQYINMIVVARRLGTCLTRLGFPVKRRFAYMDSFIESGKFDGNAWASKEKLFSELKDFFSRQS